MAFSPEVVVSFLRGSESQSFILQRMVERVYMTYNFQLADSEKPYVMTSSTLEPVSAVEAVHGPMPEVWNAHIKGAIVIERPGNRPEFKVPVPDSLTVGFLGAIALQILPDADGKPRISASLPPEVGMKSVLTHPPSVA